MFVIAAAAQQSQDPSLWVVVPAYAGATAALITVGAALRAWARRTILRRRDRYRRLSRLGTGAHLSFFEAVLGEPPAISRTVTKTDFAEFKTEDDPDFVETSHEELQIRTESRNFRESIFIDRDFYVQAFTDADLTVLAFSVTTRSTRFRPVVEPQHRPGLAVRLRYRREVGEWPRMGVRVALAKTRFADLDGRDQEEPTRPDARLSLGANNWSYSEVDYVGRAGLLPDVCVDGERRDGSWRGRRHVGGPSGTRPRLAPDAAGR